MNPTAGDWFVMGLIALVWAASTVFIFKHPEGLNFATWSGLCTTMTGFYHYQFVRDQKVADAS